MQFQAWQQVLVLDGEHKDRAGLVINQTDEGVWVRLDGDELTTAIDPASLKRLG